MVTEKKGTNRNILQIEPRQQGTWENGNAEFAAIPYKNIYIWQKNQLQETEAKRGKLGNEEK